MTRGAEYVLDASAVLALLRGEAGAKEVSRILADCILSAVNFTEVIAVLLRRGVPAPEVDAILDRLRLPVFPFDVGLARLTAKLISRTRSAGLSFGDCACLALGEQHGLVVVTAEKSWSKLDLELTVQVIR